MKQIRFLFVLALIPLILYGCPTPQYPNCKTDEHCKAKGEYCVDNQCRECRQDAHCKVKHKCGECNAVTFVCQVPDGCCQNEVDCKTGRCWIEEGKETGTCGPQCRVGHSEDCTEQQICQGGICTDVQCMTDEHCKKTEKCTDNKCESLPECVFNPIYFDLNKTTLRADVKETLKTIAECLKKTGAKIQIDGHTDNKGKPPANLVTGEKMANAVKKHLVSLGIPEEQMDVRSYGQDKPVCTEDTKECMQKNRRVEIFVP